jgi:hypothetical protein
MEFDYRMNDFGFSAAPREQLTEAVLDGGPLSGQQMKIEAIIEQKFDGGFYKRDPMITHTPPCRCQLGLVFFFRHGSQRSQSKMTRGALFRVMMIMTISIGCLSATASVFAQEGGGVSDLRKLALPADTSSKFLPAPWLQYLSDDK